MDWVDFAINVGMSAMMIAVKNPKQREKYRRIFLKLYNAIGLAFAGDPEFHPEGQ